AAFVQDTGLRLIQELLSAALRRGAHIQLLTSDYLNITQAAALTRVLDWIDENEARLDDDVETKHPSTGKLEARVIEVNKLGGRVRAFHPKSWRFEGPGLAAAFVGSSNLSHSALLTGIEWNLRVDRDW